MTISLVNACVYTSRSSACVSTLYTVRRSSDMETGVDRVHLCQRFIPEAAIHAISL
ncbi:hypothetical protein M9458_056660, partial [Cirrhinus mrigala]